VSGAAALAVQASPTATPDRVKYAFTSTARAVASTDRMAVGAGLLDAFNGALNAPPGLANVGTEPSSGTGTIDASRGTVYVSADDPVRTVVTGQMTLQLLLWNPLALFADWTGGNWYGGNWYGGNWYGGNWYGGNWYGGNWYGGNWYGQPEGGNWYGGNWYGSAWYGAWE
ncbi:MAG: hypothetical protein QOI20_2788, partial [Acidimicrobiaceae bacterium]|nr:hypothetical protein [Acidimicrobiaceae bacterium]